MRSDVKVLVDGCMEDPGVDVSEEFRSYEPTVKVDEIVGEYEENT